MSTRVLVVRADAIRHRACVACLVSAGLEVAELIERVPRTALNSLSPAQQRHFSERSRVEQAYFSEVLERPPVDIARRLTDQVNDWSAKKWALSMDPDFVVTFGCSILDNDWLSAFPNRILGIHLGLSPYYRGSGTNFFPFVNDELGAVGYTLMNLDSGIDTGNILHQARARFSRFDGIHDVGTRLIADMFDALGHILLARPDLGEAVPQPSVPTARYYRRRDFTNAALTTATSNLDQGMVGRYLATAPEANRAFPLIREV